MSWVAAPFWWSASPGELRRGGESLRIGPRDRRCLEVWRRPASDAAVAERLGFPAPEVTRRRRRLAAAGVLVPAAQARFELPAIELEITSRCNARCVMCPRPVLREHRGFAHMTPEVFAAVVRNVGGRGVPAYHLCGIGEPLLHPLCLEFAAALRRADPAARIVCVTNGFSLQPERLDALLGSPIDVLEVSLHALDEAVHRSILRSFRVGRALERLEALLARRAALGSSLDVRIGQVLVAPHPTADAELAAWAAGHGLPFATWRAWNRAGHVPEEMVTDDASEPRAFAGTNRSPEVCSDYATMLFIDHRGDVLSCCCDFANETTEGNAAEHSLEALLARRHETLASGQPLSPICERCDAPATNKPFLPTDYFAVARKPLPGGGQEPPNR